MQHANDPTAPVATPVPFPEHFATEDDATHLYVPKGDVFTSGGLTTLPIAVDSGFTITDQFENSVPNLGLAMAYLVSPDGSATSPTWTDQNDFNVFVNRVNAAAFKYVNDPS